MSPFIGEIRIFGGTFAPIGWEFCNGQLLSIQQNPALFALLETTYGGDGRTTFGLPNLQGAAAMHQGQGPGLTPRSVGETGGETAVSLTQQEMPVHNHSGGANAGGPVTINPVGAVFTTAPGGHGHPGNAYFSGHDTAMSPLALLPSGGSQPHNNMQPYLGISFIIALNGRFPSRG